MKRLVIFLAPIFLMAVAPAPQDRVMKYYEIGKVGGKPLFTHKVHYEMLSDGSLSTKTSAVDAEGKVVFTESIVSKGSTPSFHSCDVVQTQRHLELEVKNGKVIFRTKGLTPAANEPLKEDSEALPKEFISGPLSEAFAIEHLKELMNGESVKAKMGIMEIRDLVTFKFSKHAMTKVKGHDVMIVSMKPSSIFISLLVDTIYLHIDTVDKKMVHYVGRTPLWKTVDGKLKALDAEIVFE